MRVDQPPKGRFGPQAPALPHDEAFSRETGQQRDLLTFAVGGEEYAVGIDCIREIIKNRPITEVPRVPPFVAGIIAVRGIVMPVIDLRLRLRLLAAPLSPKARILVVTRPDPGPGDAHQDGGREPFGLIVDRVNQVVSLWEHDIEPPTMLVGHESDFVSGIGRIQRGDGAAESGRHPGTGFLLSRPRHMLILLDLQRVLTFEHAGSAFHLEEGHNNRSLAKGAPAAPLSASITSSGREKGP